MADQQNLSEGTTKAPGTNPPHITNQEAGRMHPGDIGIAGTEPINASASNQPGQGSTSTTGSFGGSTGSAAAATARSLIDQAKQTAGQAYEAVTDRAASTLDERKNTVSDGLSAVADTFRQAGDHLAGRQADNTLASFAGRYTGTASQKLNDVARYFEQTDVRGMVRDAEDFARRNPVLFIGAAFAAGLLAARFLKSTPPGAMGAARGETFNAQAAGAGTSDRPGSEGRGVTTPNPM